MNRKRCFGVLGRNKVVLAQWRTLSGKALWACRWRLVAAYLLGLVAVGAVVLLPWPLKLTIDYVLAGQPLPGPVSVLWQRAVELFRITPTSAGLAVLFAAAYALIAATAAVCAAAEKRIGARVRERLVLSIRDAVLVRIQSLPAGRRAAFRRGEMVLRMTDDVYQFVRLLTKTIPLIVRHVALSLFILSVMCWIEPRLALAGLAVVALLAIIVVRFGRRLHAAARDKRLREGAVAGFAQDAIKALPTVQALGSERYLRNRFLDINQTSLAAGVKEVDVAVGMERTMQIVNGCAIALMLGGGTLLVLGSRLTVGDLTVFVAYMNQLLKPVEKINELASSVSRGVSRGERLVALLEESPASHERVHAQRIDRCRGVIEFRSVGFSYSGNGIQEPLLRDVSFRLQPGELTLLTGPSGSGKSTLVNLILRQLEPSAGLILLDGVPYPQISLESLRAQCAVMLQHHDLMAGSLRDALWMRSEPIEESRIWRALAMVAMEDCLRRLPHGLGSGLAEDAVNFSGGQRARLSLARALLLDRPIMILDEPLANIDIESQRIILDALDRVRGGKTCLVISHQPVLADRVDQKLTLSAGRLVVARHERSTVASGGSA